MSEENSPGKPVRREDAAGPHAADGGRRAAEPPPVAKGLAFFLVGLVGIHFAATFLWNAPSSPVSESVAAEVNGYMRPFFVQNWSLFAPNPINAEDELLVRAQVRDPQTGDVEVTEWRNPTQLEWSLVHHNPAPSRASRLSSNLHRRLSSAWYDLTDEQQEIVADDYRDMADWRPLAGDLIDSQGGETSSEVANVVRADRVTTGYATQFAKAIWGRDVVAVQFELRRTPVPRWDERMEPEPQHPSHSTREFGWRPVLVDSEQDESAFARTVEGLQE
ncbi:hypothetical protein CLV30_103261 [Haloactinopolyspora alba]|uniref:Uncharacterized protein n=1 Tax=Haloactinopolyspora alba TaxID=648780 RepID=A0A2P8E9F7_9ACTN|nr:DUF5819 family protein [Haloactinopolyspora alba]PSL06106.1 hypothetical protein CLV30_103261 [Haloactinopolyspora alba]